MRKALRQIAMTVAVAALVAAVPAFAQQASPQPAPEQKQDNKAPSGVASGELVNVDSTAKSILVKKTDGTEMKFAYGDDTEVVGADRGLSGLATMSGSEVRVNYTTKGAINVATKIEVRAKK